MRSPIPPPAMCSLDSPPGLPLAHLICADVICAAPGTLASMLHGSCHCGALTIRFDTQRHPAELPVRTCGCTFCLKHQPRYTSDPSGDATFRSMRGELVIRYRFGLRLADFLICRSCGVFVAAFEPGEMPHVGRAVINSAVLDRAAEFVAAPTRFTAYDSEDAAARSARRAKNWTPATLEIPT